MIIEKTDRNIDINDEKLYCVDAPTSRMSLQKERKRKACSGAEKNLLGTNTSTTEALQKCSCHEGQKFNIGRVCDWIMST